MSHGRALHISAQTNIEQFDIDNVFNLKNKYNGGATGICLILRNATQLYCDYMEAVQI